MSAFGLLLLPGCVKKRSLHIIVYNFYFTVWSLFHAFFRGRKSLNPEFNFLESSILKYLIKLEIIYLYSSALVELSFSSTLRELRTLHVRTRGFGPRVAGDMQVYSVTNYNTCCFLLHLQLSKNYIKELSWTQHSNTTYLNNGQTDKNCDLVV